MLFCGRVRSGNAGEPTNLIGVWTGRQVQTLIPGAIQHRRNDHDARWEDFPCAHHSGQDLPAPRWPDALESFPKPPPAGSEILTTSARRRQ